MHSKHFGQSFHAAQFQETEKSLEIDGFLHKKMMADSEPEQ
jgi:hypothetical protein